MTAVLAFIDDAIARGLTPDEIIEAIERDPALSEAAGEAALSDLIRDTIRENWDLITAARAPDDFSGITNDAGLLEFLKSREAMTADALSTTDWQAA